MFKRIPEIDYKDIDKNVDLIDVREPFEFEGDYIKNAINIPLNDIVNYTNNNTVYIICESGNRSAQAVKYLRKKGIDAINVKGGMQSVRI